MRQCEQDQPHAWYLNNFEPTFTCQHESRIGGLGDGGKWVCDPHRIPKDKCLIWSIGSANIFNFENAVYKEISKTCEIHTFDPSVGAKPSNLPNYVKFHPWGLGSKSETSSKGWTMKSMADILSILGHQNRTIDILKIDCEGCEWTTYEQFNGYPYIRQILIELHGITKAKDLLSSMKQRGYVTFHKEPNTKGCRGRCIEYAFIHLNKKFFT